jgi:hypothetical protein
MHFTLALVNYDLPINIFTLFDRMYCSNSCPDVTIINMLIIEFTFRVYIYAYMHLQRLWYGKLDSKNKNYWNTFTFPRLRSITTEDEVTNFYYGHGWFLVITISMKGTCCPSMLSCTPTQRPISACVFGP